jgi:glycosyltransferase involved in cell wall biosynthesis
MKIVYIVPGFGGTFYCGNCLRDSAMVASLRRAGHNTVILPVYLPLVMNGEEVPDGPPVFYGAVSIYVRQAVPALRRMPGWLHRLLNSRPVLRYAARKSGSTRARGLEGLTESMLLGEQGYQASDLAEIVHYLKHHEKPDVVHFSNALLLGMARQIRAEVGIPVVCSLQDEDVWLDVMEPAMARRLWKLMGERARETDALVAVSDWFARQMQQKMEIPEGMIRTIPIGIDPSGYVAAPPDRSSRTIGYLSRINEENGFALLVDAFIQLKSDPRFSDVTLRATGGYTGDDLPFIRRQQKKLLRAGLAGDLQLLSDFSAGALPAFFEGLALLSVPVLRGEAFGLYLLEAMASGIPVVQPAVGAFSEIIGNTGGGLTYHPNTPETLAATIASLLEAPERLTALGLAGRKGVEDHYDSKVVTERMATLYQEVSNRATSH